MRSLPGIVAPVAPARYNESAHSKVQGDDVRLDVIALFVEGVTTASVAPWFLQKTMPAGLTVIRRASSNLRPCLPFYVDHPLI